LFISQRWIIGTTTEWSLLNNDFVLLLLLLRLLLVCTSYFNYIFMKLLVVPARTITIIIIVVSRCITRYIRCINVFVIDISFKYPNGTWRRPLSSRTRLTWKRQTINTHVIMTWPNVYICVLPTTIVLFSHFQRTRSTYMIYHGHLLRTVDL